MNSRLNNKNTEKVLERKLNNKNKKRNATNAFFFYGGPNQSFKII